jgi:hypothetical protein
MEFFDPKIRKQFIKNELKRSYFEFCTVFDVAYSKTKQSLRNSLGLYKNQSIDGFPQNLNNNGKEDTAKEFSSLLPAHTLKIYLQLLKCENAAIKNNMYFVLDKPIIHMVDIGCGGGSASIALLMLLTNYHKYRIENKLPIYSVSTNLLGVDINSQALIIYNLFIAKVTKEISELLINVKYTILNGKLSENSNDVLNWLKNFNIVNSCIFAFGNVIRPFQTEFLKQTEGQKSIRRKGNLINKIKFVGGTDIETLSLILEHITIDRIEIIVISSPTKKSGKYPANDWLKETRHFLNCTFNRFKGDSHYLISKNAVRKYSISVLGPKDCYFRKIKKNHNPFPAEYNAGFLFVVNKQYINIQNEWEQILNKDNLLLAWARVRNEMADATFEDTLEIRIFEINIHNRLEQLRSRLSTYDFQSLGVSKMINYLVPKGYGKTPRPMSICRIEEQILAVAILQVKAQYYSELPKNSYAYRLRPKEEKENLYEDWFMAHQNYINQARKVAIDNPGFQVIQTDLTSYYTMIQQKFLVKEFSHHFRLVEKQLLEIARQLIIRDCGIDSFDKGIPQGHILSGVLSNIYLFPIDQLFRNGNEWGLHYFRYVDDMIFVFPKNISPNTIMDRLDLELSNLGLKRSRDKTTEAMSTDYFLKLTEYDPELDNLSKRFNFLLSDLYKLGYDNYQLLKTDWWKFLDKYKQLLFSLGVFISVPRLSRKIKQNLNWWKRFLNYFKRSIVPNLNNLHDLDNLADWKTEFIRNNSEWISEQSSLHVDLKDIFKDALSVLSEREANEELKAKAKKRFKFSCNRLGKLGFDEYTDTIVEIVKNHPWLLNVRRVCDDLAFQNKKDALIKIINNSSLQVENGFVRACAIKSLQNLSMKGSDILQFACLDVQKTQIENIMSTEFGFFANVQIAKTNEIKDLIDNPKFHEAAKRNLILNLNSNDANSISNNFDLSINEAIQFRHNLSPQDFKSTLFSLEPDILRKIYYQSSYPDNDSEFPDFPSWI